MGEHKFSMGNPPPTSILSYHSFPLHPTSPLSPLISRSPVFIMSNEPPKKESVMGVPPFVIDFLMGGVSAAVSKTAAAPIERVKLLIQNQDEMLKTGRLDRKYDGIAECFKRTTAQEGVASGATSLLFVYSLDYARTRLANDNKNAKTGGERQFNGLVDVYKKTLASDGIAGLYRGFGPSVAGIVVYRGLYFGMYDSIKPVLLVGPLEGNFLASFPLDTIRRRMMMTSGEAVKYKSSMDAGRQII